MHTKKHTILRRIDRASSTPAQIFSEATPFFITCQAGIESLVKQEVSKLGLNTIEVADRIVRVTGSEKQMYELLVWSRFSNRIYLELSHGAVTTFDELFALVKRIPWRQYLHEGIAIVTEATSIKSLLAHTPSLQSVTKKAIVEQLTAGTGTHHLYEDRSGHEAHIQVFLRDNTAHILLDITGTALHKRGYRLESWDAPIKENLAAALVALSGWRFRMPLLDPFCGSGTIAIEAAMLARNLAPGMGRHFAVEYMPFFQKSLLTTVREEAKKRSYPSGSYHITGRDIDPKMIDIARANATRAGVDADICFEAWDFFSYSYKENPITLVTNPPYGVRLENSSDAIFYTQFLQHWNQENLHGGFITSYEGSAWWIDRNIWKDRKIYNGWLPARFYKKHST